MSHNSKKKMTVTNVYKSEPKRINGKVILPKELSEKVLRILSHNVKDKN